MSLNTYAITNLLFCALLMPACNAARQAPEVGQPPFYVLSGKEAEKLVEHCSSEFIRGVEGYWTPSGSDLQRLTVALNAYLNSFSPNESATLLNFISQYAGTIKGGRKLIFVNGFAKAFGEVLATDRDWRTRAFVGCGGGKMIFGVEYDVETQSLQNFAFNPER